MNIENLPEEIKKLITQANNGEFDPKEKGILHTFKKGESYEFKDVIALENRGVNLKEHFTISEFEGWGLIESETCYLAKEDFEYTAYYMTHTAAVQVSTHAIKELAKYLEEMNSLIQIDKA